jgi:intracellular sulfur oxidation DsrE/DsrF family protein
MRKIVVFLFAIMVCMAGFSQNTNTDSLRLKKDSTLRAMIHADSLKVEKEYAEKEHWEKIKAVAQHPAINAGEYSGIVPVNDPTEVPDPKIEYKILFEITYNNPDSIAKDPNYALVEIARVINLHVASGIPINKIMPVIVVHAGALNAISNNAHYQERYKMDNPNLKLINDLKNIGAKFIACGQAMAFFKVKKEDLLPDVKVSLTAQTVLTSYQLKGYVWRRVNVE